MNLGRLPSCPFSPFPAPQTQDFELFFFLKAIFFPYSSKWHTHTAAAASSASLSVAFPLWKLELLVTCLPPHIPPPSVTPCPPGILKP